MAKMKLKKGDLVVVIAGTDKGAKGKIKSVDSKNQRVIVEGVNVVTKHEKARGGMQQGGLVKTEAPIHISNVMYLHDGVPTRLGVKTEVKEENGKTIVTRSRFAKKSETKEVID